MYLDSNQITQVLPQAYPFVMIDRVVEFKKGESLTAVKNITANEWVFGSPLTLFGANPERRPSATALGPSRRGEDWHQPIDVFPETLLLEAALQAGLLLYHLSKIKDETEKVKYILGRIKADFKDSVFIGDQVYIKAFANKMMETGGYSD
ncbi:MAG: hypothetical protein HZA28_01175 [Candidatus Omnitrophica bacterium]|nr:hypothetical protein [Candidatus Omnitrophota bacterium]